MSYRVFSRNDAGFGVECPRCKEVLKVRHGNLRQCGGGWEAEPAVLCPCGYRSSFIEAETPAAVFARSKSADSALAKGCGTAIAVAMLLLVGTCIVRMSIPESAEAASARKAESERVLSANSKWDGSVYWVEKYLKENLKDPGSYEGIDWSPVKDLGGGRMAVRHKYRAKNSFGGYVIENKIVVYDRSGTVLSVSDFSAP